MLPSIARHTSSPSSTTDASAAWKNAVCVRSSQPLAASCGNSRIGIGATVLPPAMMTSDRKKMSPTSSASARCGSGSGSRSICTHPNAARPKRKYSAVPVMNALGAIAPMPFRSTRSAMPNSAAPQTAR